ncbi:hypothetical protein BuS5_03696 [Desulfosarcina sp. BuS5]|nr:hypothetical protein BuS5_03696 [Desulfosarcina sp. BuS5]
MVLRAGEKIVVVYDQRWLNITFTGPGNYRPLDNYLICNRSRAVLPYQMSITCKPLSCKRLQGAADARRSLAIRIPRQSPGTKKSLKFRHPSNLVYTV